jgi:DNA-binding SARP family transcriptional activator/TolB-like protein/cytochrome c-type biogenesis protein CcmH/NrfG
MQATSYLGKSILPRSRKAKAALAFMCLAPDRQVSRARLAAILWDRSAEAQARLSLRQALHEISGAMGELAPELLTLDRETMTLNTALCWIDAAAMVDPAMPPGEFLRSDLVSLCTGELLEGFDGLSVSFDHWLLTERARLTWQLRKVFETELQRATEGGFPAPQRASIARQLIAFDATHEGASRVLMRALADSGERAQALREYERCRETLKRSLDVEPSRETQALYNAIRTIPMRPEPEPTSPAPVVALNHHPKFQSGAVAAARGRLRVGVLPFLATGPLPDENLAFSLGQEIATALARFRWFDVIAPVSLSRAPGEPEKDPAQLKHLHYAVDGAVSRTGDQLQINVRLLDLAQDVRPVWSDRFELDVNELGRVNELVTARLVARIDPVILFIEGQQLRRQQSGALGLLLQAIPLIYRMEREKYEEAGRLIRQALEIDPDNAMACAWAAYWEVFNVGQGWTRDVEQSLAAARRMAMTAIKLDPENAEALAIYAHVCAYLDKDFDSALHYYDRSLRLNPNLVFAWSLSALTYCYVGEPDIALQRLARYRELAPFAPYDFLNENIYTIAYTFKGDYEQAATVGRRVVKANPNYSAAYKPLITALGHLGRSDEAQPYIRQLLALEPNFTVRRHGEVYPFRRDADRQRYLEGLRRAGVPEG